jgi:hypothetical protein
MSNGWIGVDLDGTLAHYDVWRGEDHIGAPIPAMVDRVKQWLEEGLNVRIFTARVGAHQREVIAAWCRKHLGRELPVTATKDFSMIALWDDRCVQVETNTGRRMDGATT